MTNQKSLFNHFKVFVGDDRASDSIDAVGNISSIRYINISKFESSIDT